MIIITGANGQLGRDTVKRLLERVPAEQVGVSVRDPAKADDLEARGVRVRQGDFTDAASLAHAFEGASQVLVMPANLTGEKRLNMHRTAIEQAKAAGARRVLYASHAGANSSSPFPPMPDHFATEGMLRDSGLEFTALRNGFYAASAAMLLRGALETGELAAPEDGPVAWTAHADLADAAAIALADGRLDGVTPALTGPEALDMAGVAGLASEVTGRLIRRVVVSEDQYRADAVARGIPEQAVGMLLGLFAAARLGQFARVDPTLGELIGRPPTPLREVLEETLSPQPATSQA
ncbi:MAG: NAD(P)H-binding protein [Actinomycetota bacterium]|nr:NAD(P)H-binding protein [Actinomycetota bacterium]